MRALWRHQWGDRGPAAPCSSATVTRSRPDSVPGQECDLDQATRRYTALHGRLLSLARLSPLLQPAVRPPARQQVQAARTRHDPAEDGRVPASARHRGGQRPGDRRGRRRGRDRAAEGGRDQGRGSGTLPRLRATGAHAGQEGGVQGRIDWRIHDLAQDPGTVAPADLVVLHRVVCCYPAYERLLGAAADHARRALVFSYPPRNVLSRAFYGCSTW
jgi:hypothetical protein